MWQLSQKHIVRNLRRFKESFIEAILIFFKIWRVYKTKKRDKNRQKQTNLKMSSKEFIEPVFKLCTVFFINILPLVK